MRIPAVFMRGGTSNAVVFHLRDLPSDRALWDAIFLAAIGSPDRYGRQLDGMGGGVSSLSKVCIVGPPTRPDADIDYTFAQVQVREARVDYSANCGNMLSAMGPFAVDEGLVPASGTSAMVRIHNTNTGKVAHAHFALDEGSAAVDGDLEIPGVHGSGAAVRLEFRDPGGAATGKLLPTGNVLDVLDVPGLGRLEASMIDAASACVFVEAASLGLAGTEMPDAIEASKDLLAHLQAIRLAASAAMGISKSPEEAARKMAPFVAFVSGPRDALSLSGEAVPAASADFTARILSNGQPHRALPLTSSLCMAVASRITGSVVNRVARASGAAQAPIRIAMPSGVMVVGASVANTSAGWHAQSGEFQRTQRRLFEGRVLLRASKLQLEDG